MADEMPVSDVLCEAMEYLSKLGSNLRSRSENLKEKRINKNKLKNSHAVQKAASKVLLICELSKKSLDNVETGVRRVLSLLDTPGASSSIGGKTSNDKPTSSKEHYFEYGSRKLRIMKKIPIKHYMSAKVLAKRMPTSMCEKYPVYLDCKLYRSRRRLLERKKSKDSAEQSKERKSSIYKSDTEQTSQNQEGDSAQNTKLNEDNKVSKVNSAPHDKNDKSNEDGDGEDKVGKSKSNMDDVAGHDQFNEKKKETNISVAENDSKNEALNSKPKKSLDKAEQDKAETEKKNGYDSDDSLQNKNRQSEVNSDNDSLTSGKHYTKIKSSKDTKKYQDKASKTPKVLENKQKKYKHLIIPQDSSDDEDKEKERNSPAKDKTLGHSSSDEGNSDNCPSREPKSKKMKLSDPVSDSQEQVESDTAISKKENEVREESDKVSDDSKPLIRCVNISKLLKPDVLGKVANKIIKTGTKNNNELSIRKKKMELIKEQAGKRMDNQVKKTADSCKKNNADEEYWAQKREEVKSFKSKEFSININRLPKLSVKFLYSHSLMRITQEGAVICESEKVKKSNSKKSAEDISEVKSALLNDSESDNETALPVAVASKKVKDCLLNDSDSDNTLQNDSHSRYKKNKNKDTHSNESGPIKEVQIEKATTVTNKESELNEENSPTRIKHALLNESDSDKNDGLGEEENGENTIPSVEKTNDLEKIKDALLNDSDSDKNEEQRNKDKNKEDEGHQFTDKEFKEFKEKVTEIIKSSLLNDSDSDKNENSEIDAETENKDDDDVQDRIDESKNNEHQNDDTADKSDDVTSNSNEKDSDKPSPSKDPESVKSALLNDSSDSASASQDNKSREKKLRVKKHDEDSVNAKKKLLNYSSSSDAENERSQGSSDEDITKRLKRKHHKKSRRPKSSSSSNEDDIKNPQKKLKLDAKSSDKQSQDSSNEDNSSNKPGTTGKETKSSSRKMVRSKAKPSGSSGQSSDNQDDKDVDGLTNLNSLNKSHRRRDSSSTTATNNTQDTSTKKSRSKMMIGEDLLQPESSSDSISDNGNNDNSDVEELPPVSVTGLNGGSIDHLAKDDLLDDSDSSGSHDKDKNEDVPNVEDSEEEDNVKAKRRKANAISSDSEVGSSRRKDRDVRLSDFEDSEAECSDSNKKNKRKKAGDSDGSSGSSDAGKKKRRRIKQLNDSDGSGSDSETEGRNKHGRKNIRKVMGKNQLEEATKKAAREEKERIARISERQKLYNNLEFDESGKPDEVVLEKVVLDFDPETKEPLIEVDRGLVKKLKPHQANGIKFMWDACFESVKRIKKDRGSGCILAHCMGLGKTLQVISLAHTLLTQARLTGVRRVLVVCPLSTVLNWVGEFRMWLKHAHTDYDLDIYELSRFKQNSERAYQMRQWLEGGGVCVLGYEMFRNLSQDNTKKYKKKMLKSFQESLVDPGPDLVVCDEGHLLKNEKTSLSQSMNRVRTRRRIVLTGTPLQNNLKEYYCMVQFVKPNLLGKYNEYLNRFVNPITNGQYTDSTEQDIRVMKRRSHVLHKMLDGAVQRRDYGVLAPFLPPKHEYVLFITLTDVQINLYRHYLDNYSRRPLPGKSSGFLFPDFQSLQRIWTHPLVLKYNSERYEIMQQKKRDREEEEDSEGSLADFIDDDSTPDESSTEESSDDLSDVSDDSRKKSKKKKAGKKGKGKDAKVTARRGTRANPELEEVHVVDGEGVPEPEGVEEVVKNDNPTEWWVPLVPDDELEDLRHSHKLVLLFNILRQCEAIGDKLLVFSQSLYSLDLIEHFLGKVDEATQEGRIDEKLGGHIGAWSPGVDYFRLDGSTSCENRSIWCKNFNREDNPRARLFLISTRAGGLGINLVAANRVVIFDVSWNPSHDVQSIFRVYRFGQKKPCYVYRFLAMGTMEEKIYERQVTKQAISKRVIDEQQIDRHYAENDLAELYTFQPRPEEPRALPTLPKDRLFAEMLKEHDVQIFKYHEHDSLLENKEEETLSEEERKAAWEDFENEKSRPPPAPFPSPWPMHNGMMPGLLAPQQQQLAMAAFTAILGKDGPKMSESQIRELLPLIYNSNPGLMQKMSEIYKYAPGMMNPGMMNPVMNPGGGGMSGTSGLQYEPPWQRQQQQQNQMRLQQLLQQQNQMGAKFYAGGLGSRDPVAMALQQQRAREIMLSGGGAASAAGAGGPGGAGRPRGRPPLQPRAPAHNAPAGDVVDLDSD